MNKHQEIDIMDSLLRCDASEEIPEVESLTCLIYSDIDSWPDNQLTAPLAPSVPKPDRQPQQRIEPDTEPEPAWNTENDKLKVRVWESHGKIRIKVSPKPAARISIQRLADIALNAIMEDLQREEP